MVLTEAELKERKRIRNQKWYQKNKERIKERCRVYNKEYRKKNKEKKKEYARLNPDKYVIANWKHHGIIHDNYKELYKYYMSINNCQVCDKEFNKESQMNYRCLDHDHDTGLFRCVCCGDCNLHNRMIK